MNESGGDFDQVFNPEPQDFGPPPGATSDPEGLNPISEQDGNADQDHSQRPAQNLDGLQVEAANRYLNSVAAQQQEYIANLQAQIAEFQNMAYQEPEYEEEEPPDFENDPEGAQLWLARQTLQHQQHLAQRLDEVEAQRQEVEAQREAEAYRAQVDQAIDSSVRSGGERYENYDELVGIAVEHRYAQHYREAADTVLAGGVIPGGVGPEQWARQAVMFEADSYLRTAYESGVDPAGALYDYALKLQGVAGSQRQQQQQRPRQQQYQQQAPRQGRIAAANGRGVPPGVSPRLPRDVLGDQAAFNAAADRLVAERGMSALEAASEVAKRGLQFYSSEEV